MATNIIIDGQETPICDGCPHLKVFKYGYNKGQLQINCFCESPRWPRKLLLDGAAPATPCPMPSNCPHKEERLVELAKPSWQNIKPLCPFDKIKTGNVYYIPPIQDCKIRRTVEVTNVTSTYVTTKILKSSTPNDAQYKSFYFSSDIECKFFIPKIL